MPACTGAFQGEGLAKGVRCDIAVECWELGWEALLTVGTTDCGEVCDITGGDAQSTTGGGAGLSCG